MSEKKKKIQKSFLKMALAPIRNAGLSLRSYRREWSEALGCVRDSVLVRVGKGSAGARWVFKDVTCVHVKSVLPQGFGGLFAQNTMGFDRYFDNGCQNLKLGARNAFKGWTPGWQKRFNKSISK